MAQMTPVNIIVVDFSVITHSSMSFIFTGTPILVKCIAFSVWAIYSRAVFCLFQELANCYILTESLFGIFSMVVVCLFKHTQGFSYSCH